MLNMTVAADDGEIVTVQCEGDINQIYFQMGNPLEKLLGAATFARKVVVDLQKVNYLDSSGLSWLVACHKRFVQQGGRMVLCGMSPRILQVLQFCRMDRLFGITEDEATARARLQGEKP
jgi:anti-anti-sigma factor